MKTSHFSHLRDKYSAGKYAERLWLMSGVKSLNNRTDCAYIGKISPKLNITWNITPSTKPHISTLFFSLTPTHSSTKLNVNLIPSGRKLSPNDRMCHGNELVHSSIPGFGHVVLPAVCTELQRPPFITTNQSITVAHCIVGRPEFWNSIEDGPFLALPASQWVN